jgi:hypothetical protein
MSESEFDLLPNYPHKFPLVRERNSRIARDEAEGQNLDFQQTALVKLGFAWNFWLPYNLAVNWQSPVYPTVHSLDAVSQWQTYMHEAAGAATVAGNTDLANDLLRRMAHDESLLRQFESSASTLESAFPPKKQDESQSKLVAAQTDQHSLALLSVFTNGMSDERIKRAAELLGQSGLTANEKLWKIDAILPFPATASAEQLGFLVGVTKQAVFKTDWWTMKRKGEKENEIGRRKAGHQNRAEDRKNAEDDDH